MSWYVINDSTGCRLNVEGVCGIDSKSCSQETCPKKLHKKTPDETTYELQFMMNRKELSKSHLMVKNFDNMDELNKELTRFIKITNDDKNIVENPPTKEEGNDLAKWANMIMKPSPTIGYSYEINLIEKTQMSDEMVDFHNDGE
jgi:hypothetical protein